MSVLKRVSTTLLTAAVALSLASCGKNTVWAAKINDFEVKAGVFISSQLNAYYSAMEFMTEEDTEVLKLTIEDKPAEEWINDKATSLIQEFTAIEQKFGELGLSFKNNEDTMATNYVNQLWDYYGSVYEGLGISKQSEIDVYVNNYKRASLFDYYYGKGGEKEIPEADIKQYIYDNYAMIRYIEMPLKDGEGNLLKSAGKADMLDMANGYIERAKAGENFDLLIDEFKKYYDDMVAEAVKAENGDEESESEAENEAAETEDSEVETPDNRFIMEKSGTTPNQAVVDKIFSGDVSMGDYTIVELDEVYYVVEFLDILTLENYLEDNDSAMRHSIKDEEFGETITEWTKGQNVVKNEAAYRKYKAKKFEEE